MSLQAQKQVKCDKNTALTCCCFFLECFAFFFLFFFFLDDVTLLGFSRMEVSPVRSAIFA
jgi:hypothetical protein